MLSLGCSQVKGDIEVSKQDNVIVIFIETETLSYTTLDTVVPCPVSESQGTGKKMVQLLAGQPMTTLH